MKPLYKTILVIWSEFDPNTLEIDELAKEATSGLAYCSVDRKVKIENPTKDPDWDGTTFFGEL